MQIEEGQRTFLVSAASQLLSAQNNPYAKVTYLGVAHSSSLHLHWLQGTIDIQNVITPTPTMLSSQ